MKIDCPGAYTTSVAFMAGHIGRPWHGLARFLCASMNPDGRRGLACIFLANSESRSLGAHLADAHNSGPQQDPEHSPHDAVGCKETSHCDDL